MVYDKEMKHLTPYRQKRNIPLAGEGEKDGVWGWIKGLSYEPNWAVPERIA